MPTRATRPGSSQLNRENLLERVLTARPDVGIDDIRNLAPPYRDLPEPELVQEIARIRQRIVGKVARRKRS